jgi:hypothetical protein
MKNTLIALFILMLTSSCVSYITPAIGGNTSINYIPRPAFKGTINKESSISGTVISQSPIDHHLNMFSGMLSLNKGYTTKNLNWGFGAFGVLGKAHFKDSTSFGLGTTTSPIKNFNKSFYGGGLRMTFGFQMVTNNRKFNFRILNWENAISIEKGDYQNYRKELLKKTFIGGKEVIYVSNISTIFTTGLSTEIFWNEAFGDPDLKIGYRIFSGYSPKVTKSYIILNREDKEISDRSGVVNFSLFIKAQKFYFTTEAGTDSNFGTKISLGYVF